MSQATSELLGADPPARPSVSERLIYLARILRVYANRSSGPLSFWYERPELNERAFNGSPDYFMRLAGKADYDGLFDHTGIPLLDYRGDIGRQYNPIAIAQYGLARFNRWSTTKSSSDEAAWIAVAQWLTRELRPNAHGVAVWMHDFDWPYRQTLRAPWYSGLAQGNGISMLVRAAQYTGITSYAEAAHRAFEAMTCDVADGGVVTKDGEGHTWIEEYIVDPPSHIFNGFIWALWGVYDYAKWSGSARAWTLWNECVRTLEHRLDDFDTGWWSLYEMPHAGKRMLASHYYHTLHITQLRVLHRLTESREFADRADAFEHQLLKRRYRLQALIEKAIFKLRHY